jgi:hypothetical protein
MNFQLRSPLTLTELARRAAAGPGRGAARLIDEGRR